MIKIIDRPNTQVECQVYNSDAGLIVEILDTGSLDHPYLVEYSRRSNDYRVESKEYAPNYACAVLRAKHFCNTGTRL
jgi:hypothetical protein